MISLEYFHMCCRTWCSNGSHCTASSIPPPRWHLAVREAPSLLEISLKHFLGMRWLMWGWQGVAIDRSKLERGEGRKGSDIGREWKEVVLQGRPQGTLAAWVLALPFAAGPGCHQRRLLSSLSRTPHGSIIFWQCFSFPSIFTPDPYLRADTTMDPAARLHVSSSPLARSSQSNIWERAKPHLIARTGPRTLSLSWCSSAEHKCFCRLWTSDSSTLWPWWIKTQTKSLYDPVWPQTNCNTVYATKHQLHSPDQHEWLLFLHNYGSSLAQASLPTDKIY